MPEGLIKMQIFFIRSGVRPDISFVRSSRVMPIRLVHNPHLKLLEGSPHISSPAIDVWDSFSLSLFLCFHSHLGTTENNYGVLIRKHMRGMKQTLITSDSLTTTSQGPWVTCSETILSMEVLGLFLWLCCSSSIITFKPHNVPLSSEKLTVHNVIVLIPLSWKRNEFPV